MANEHHAQSNAHPNLNVLAGGVAVITGGASGIGLALAEKAIAHGLHAVLADIEAPAIAAAEQHWRQPRRPPAWRSTATAWTFPAMKTCRR